MESLKVADYMKQRAVTFKQDMPVAEAVERLLASHQTGGPVVNDNRQLVGFLSEKDCIRQMIESSYYREQVARVKDVMFAEPISVKPYHSVIEVAQQMVQPNKPKMYPVVDDDGRLLGVIDRGDVLHAIDVQLQDGYKDVG